MINGKGVIKAVKQGDLYFVITNPEINDISFRVDKSHAETKL